VTRPRSTRVPGRSSGRHQRGILGRADRGPGPVSSLLPGGLPVRPWMPRQGGQACCMCGRLAVILRTDSAGPGRPGSRADDKREYAAGRSATSPGVIWIRSPKTTRRGGSPTTPGSPAEMARQRQRSVPAFERALSSARCPCRPRDERVGGPLGDHRADAVASSGSPRVACSARLDANTSPAPVPSQSPAAGQGAARPAAPPTNASAASPRRPSSADREAEYKPMGFADSRR